MLKTRLKSFIILLIITTLYTCIDPYNTHLKGYEYLLVVDGLITNETGSNEVRLTRTMDQADAIPDKVTDANVYITDEYGNITALRNTGNGIYKTDSTTFTGVIGKTYTLHINTPDGKEFVSEPCTMLPVPDIDSIYYEKDKDLSGTGTESFDGIRIYADSEPGDINTYYRWGYEETWKFKLPAPVRYIYINESTITPLENVKEFCWMQHKTDEILINSTYSSDENVLRREPITFIAPEKSDRLTIQYSILVKQYSISQKEYEFWNNLKKVNDINVDIFGKQPFPVISNISDTQHSGNKVAGYFQVSAVSQKRLTIKYSDLSPLNLPRFKYDCVKYDSEPADYCKGQEYCVPPTWDELYRMWTNAQFKFIEPHYLDQAKTIIGKLIFASPACVECEGAGTTVKPDFWVDLK